MIDEVMGAAGVDPNWTAEEWTQVLKYALDERDEARAIADARTKQWAQTVAVSEKLRQEYAKVVAERDQSINRYVEQGRWLDEARIAAREILLDTHDEPGLVERYEAKYPWLKAAE